MSAVESIVPKNSDRLIGVILVEAGRLKLEDAERILRLQREQGLRFGEAALKLGLVSSADKIGRASCRERVCQYV